MPSTTSSDVSMVLDSSTVMTPSLPTFFIAPAMMSPMCLSLLALMVPTWAIMSPLTSLCRRRTSSTATSTAFSMPRFRAVGLAPAATAFTPSRKMAWARTVAVVVPSPATSEVFDATSRTICAPIFSSAFDSSISLATVTPSLVIVGEPNFFSITTLRPFGPSVTFTASARMLTPRRIACRESSPCRICFAIVLLLFLGSSTDQIALNEAPEAPIMRRSRGIRHEVLLLEDAEDFFFAHDQQLFAVDLDLGARVLAEQDAVASLDVEREHLALVVRLALANG